MAAVISGNDLGIYNNILGGGSPRLGRESDRVYVNSQSGNLLLQQQDQYLAVTGQDVALVRSYNSQGIDNVDKTTGA